MTNLFTNVYTGSDWLLSVKYALKPNPNHNHTYTGND